MTVQGFFYQCSPDITWVRDTGGTLLVDAVRAQAWSLSGVEASIWEWLTLAYPYDKVVHFLSVLLRIRADEAEETLLSALRGWLAAGILQISGENESGESSDQRRL